MLHVTTEVGIPGKRERERRHFSVHNHPSQPLYKSTGRVYIPHGSGYEDKWKPHPQNIEPEPTEGGLDWKSRLKYIPPPQNPNRFPAAEIFPDNWRGLRSIPYTYYRSNREWLLDPADTYNPNGLKTSFGGVHKATLTSDNEITHRLLFGRGRNEQMIDRRNGIPEASPGDKNYQAVEYSDNFHVKGTTLPVINFGKTFKEKEVKRINVEDIQCVKDLDNWKPATPLHMTLPQEEKKDK